jgi:hypothetical protein
MEKASFRDGEAIHLFYPSFFELVIRESFIDALLKSLLSPLLILCPEMSPFNLFYAHTTTHLTFNPVYST